MTWHNCSCVLHVLFQVLLHFFVLCVELVFVGRLDLVVSVTFEAAEVLAHRVICLARCWRLWVVVNIDHVHSVMVALFDNLAADFISLIQSPPLLLLAPGRWPGILLRRYYLLWVYTLPLQHCAAFGKLGSVRLGLDLSKLRRSFSRRVNARDFQL